MTEENQSENNQAEPGSVTLPKPGDLLRVQRETAGMSYVMVAEALHLTVHYIKALENDEYSKLPGLTFVKGYFRAYARFLRMDETEVIKCYESYLQELGEQVSEQENSSRLRKRNDQVTIWAVIAGVILVVGLAAGWWFYGRSQNSSTAVSLPRPQTNAVQSSVVSTARPLATTDAGATVSALPEAALASDSGANPGENPGDEQAETSAFAALPEDTASTDADMLSAADNTEASQPAADESAATGSADEPGAVSLSLNEAASIETENTADNSEAGLGATGSGTTESGTAAPASESSAAPEATGDASLPSSASSTTITETDSIETAAEEGGKTPAADQGYRETNTISATGTRDIQLFGEGDDRLQLNFRGTSWVEVDDAAEVRLYNDLMNAGDALTIQATTPFYILLGDATQVEVLLNADKINFSNRIRQDKSARFMISNNGASRWVSR